MIQWNEKHFKMTELGANKPPYLGKTDSNYQYMCIFLLVKTFGFEQIKWFLVLVLSIYAYY